MVTAQIALSKATLEGTVNLPASKSIHNRLQILQAYKQNNIHIENPSNADDCLLLKDLITKNSGQLDVKNAGTVARFLTAFFASKPGVNITLTGNERMKQRPIKPLIDALLQLGAQITYTEKLGCFPINIVGNTLTKNVVTIDGSESSQFISALMLIGTNHRDRLEINLTKKPVSFPYIELTANLIKQLGGEVLLTPTKITVVPKPLAGKITVEADWSAASYFLAMLKTVGKGSLRFPHLSLNSLQGDKFIADFFKENGLTFTETTVGLMVGVNKNVPVKEIKINLQNYPDLAQTFAVFGASNNISTWLTGLQTLVLKETNRIKALTTELKKLGIQVQSTNNSLAISGKKNILLNTKIDTYADHRMAMAFAILATKNPITIVDIDVVKKSYPHFWETLINLGFVMNITT